MSTATVLYDAPGPKARRRSQIISVIGVVLILAVLGWAIWQLAQPRLSANGAETPGMFDASRWDIWTDSTVWKFIGAGAVNTLKVATLAMIGALVLGTLFAFGRMSEHRWISWPTYIVLEFFRGMPILLMMLFILLIASTGPFWAVVSALAVYNGAIICEALRAGFVSLPKGQREAGLSIGLTTFQSRMLIEFPQAFTQMLPIIIAQLIVLLKDTSLGYIVAYTELSHSVKALGNFYGNRYLFSTWVVAISIYLVINLTASALGRRAARLSEVRRRAMRPTG